jgi:DoxX-like family
MFVATLVVSLLLAALLSYAAIRKLGHSEPVVATYARVGVPEDKLDYLAAILLAGAAGLAVVSCGPQSASPPRSAWSLTSSSRSRPTSGPATPRTCPRQRRSW